MLNFLKKPTFAQATLNTTATWTKDLIGAWIFCESTGITIKDFSRFGNHIAVSNATDGQWEDNPAGAAGTGANRWALAFNVGPKLNTFRVPTAGRPTMGAGAENYAFLGVFKFDMSGKSSGQSLTAANQLGYIVSQSLGKIMASQPNSPFKIQWQDGAFAWKDLASSMATNTIHSYFITEAQSNTTTLQGWYDGNCVFTGARKFTFTGGYWDLFNNDQAMTNWMVGRVGLIYEWNRNVYPDELQAIAADPLTPFGQTELATTPSPPSAPTTTSLGRTTIILDWPDSTDPNHVSYGVFRSDGGAYAALASGLTVSDFSDTTVTEGTRYSYFVTDLNSTGLESSASTAATFTTTIGSPTGPSLGVPVTNTQVVLSWNPYQPPLGQGYAIYEAVGTPSVYSLVATAPTAATQYTVPGLFGGYTYYFQVAAVNQYGTPGSALVQIQANPPEDIFFLKPSVVARPISQLMQSIPVGGRGRATPDIWQWLDGAN